MTTIAESDIDSIVDAGRSPGGDEHIVACAADTSFTWDYERSREGLSKLYEKAKTSQWNVTTDLPWETEVDQERMAVDRTTSTVHEYSLSKHKDRLEPFYRLGFSISGRDIQDRYLVTIIGEQQVGDNRTLVLELTPERDAERAVVGKIKLWVDQSSWMPRRQEFSSTGNGITTTLDYTSMARNLRLNPDLFDDDWPRGTDKERH